MANDQTLTIKVSAETKSRIIAASKANRRNSYSEWCRLVLEGACNAVEADAGDVIAMRLSAEDMALVRRAALLDYRDVQNWAQVTLVNRARRIIEDAEARGVANADAAA